MTNDKRFLYCMHLKEVGYMNDLMIWLALIAAFVLGYCVGVKKGPL